MVRERHQGIGDRADFFTFSFPKERVARNEPGEVRS